MELNQDRLPHIGTEQIQILERLCNASGVSGDEGEVRKIVLEQIEPYAQEVQVDSMGNVLATCRPAAGNGAGAPRLRVLAAAHMDEVGLMLTNDEGDGYFRIGMIGGIDPRQLVAKTVLVGPERIPAVIGAPPIHLSSAAERENSLSLNSLRLDVGPGNAGKVKVGDSAVFSTRFAQVGQSLRAKALDDRLGVVTLIELVKNPPPNVDLLAAFTVQEEAGLRGAQIAGYALNPQAAIALDCTPALDLPSWERLEGQVVDEARFNTRLGAGPAIYVADGGTFSDPRLVRHLMRTAEAAGIPFQFRQPGGGRTDAAAIHLKRGGVPSVSLSAPGRYMHTAVSLVRLSDWEHLLALAYLALSGLTPDLLSTDR